MSADTTADWLKVNPEFVTIAEAPGEYVWMTFLLVRRDRTFPMGCDWRGQLFPTQNPIKDWQDHSPQPFLQDDILDNFTKVLEWLIRLSAMTAGRDRELNESEQAAFEHGVGELQAAFDPFRAELERTGDPDIAGCFEAISDMVRRLDAESKEPPEGQCLAAELQAMGRGGVTDVGFMIMVSRVALMERALRERQVLVATG